MNRSLILRLGFAPVFLLSLASVVFAQETGNTTIYSGQVMSSISTKPSPVQGAPYSATITNESIQTLADGNRLVQTSTGTTARDSQGRTRQDTVLPAIGNLSAANAPHLVFIHDPVAQTSYTLNLSEKTAQKMPALPPLGGVSTPGVAGATITMRVVEGHGVPLAPPEADAMPTTIAAPAAGMFFEKHLGTAEQDQGNTEDLGSQTVEGVLVNGVRTTHKIPAGKKGKGG